MHREIYRFCPNCGEITQSLFVRHQPKIEFEGETYEVSDEFVRCIECDISYKEKSFNDPSKQVLEMYRARHNVPTKENFISKRLKLGLTLEQFAHTLGITKRDLALIEKGALPPKHIIERFENA